MKKDVEKEVNKLFKPKKTALVFSTIIAISAVFASAVSTYAWFQAANAQSQIHTTSENATVSVKQPDLVHFYYFKGNGVAGESSYTGYSKSDATFGNTTNIINTVEVEDEYDDDEDVNGEDDDNDDEDDDDDDDDDD